MSMHKHGQQLPNGRRATQAGGREGERGPEPLGEVLGRLFAARGWGRRQERLRLEKAWAETVGPAFVHQTRVGILRRGVLEILVADAITLQELAHFQQRRLLEELRRRLQGVTLARLRFRTGA
jgi:predicted nucleic acid-binding Zn ribbon protein